MNNDIKVNVLQYSDELQKVTKETEQYLFKLQNDKIKEFKNNINNISNNCIADIQLLINQTHSKVVSNFSNNEIDHELIDNFNFTVQSILLQAKNDLDTYKNQFDIDISESISEETLKLKNFIKENHGKIESELHNALYQINQSENSALKRLEETYDLGVETIISAEKTALKNLKILSEKLSIKLEGKIEEIEKVILEKLQNALDKIKELEDTAISNITKLEIAIKNSLQIEKEKIIAEVKQLIDNFKFTLQGYVDEMKAELTAHKDKLLEEITMNKEEIFIELEKFKNGIIEELREKEYEFIQEMTTRAQELIAEIFSTVQGFDLELEIIKTAKIKEFTEALNLLKEQYLKEYITVIEDCLRQLQTSTEEHKEELLTATSLHLIELRNACVELLNNLKQEADIKKEEVFIEIEKKKDEIVDGLLELSKEEIYKYIASLTEQRFTTILQANKTEIQLPEKFVLNNRAKVYVDGVLLLPEAFFDINIETRTIILKESYSYDTNIFVTADMPDSNVQAMIEQFYIDVNAYLNKAIAEIIENGKRETQQIINTGNQYKSEIIAEGVKQNDSISKLANGFLTKIEESFINKNKALEQTYTEYLNSLSDKYSEYDSLLSQNYSQYLQEILKQSNAKISEIQILSQSKIQEINSLSSKHITLLNNTFSELNNKATEKLNSNLIILDNKIKDGFANIDNKIEKASNTISGRVNQAYKDIDKHLNQSVLNSKENIKQYVDKTVKPEIENHGQLKVEEFINTTVKPEIVRYSNEHIDHYINNTIKPDLNNFNNQLKESSKQEIGAFKEECKQELHTENENLITNSKEEIKNYIGKFTENKYYIELSKGQNKVNVPIANMELNNSVKVYFDGVLQNENKQYTLDFANNSINILEIFQTNIEVMLLQNLPVSNLPHRSATDEEINAMFES